jgi:hypothetical protein
MDGNGCPALKSGTRRYIVEYKFKDKFKGNVKGARLKAAATNSTSDIQRLT